MRAPTERPLLVSGPLINPILRGEKRVTRRLVRDVEAIPFPGLTWDTVRIRSISILDGIPCATWATADGGGGGPISRRAAPCTVGDVLWVRETWAEGEGDDGTTTLYYAASNGPWTGPWRPSIHMPRKAARIFLRVEGVRVERVQDITEEDARAEGLPAACSTATERWIRGGYRLTCDQCGEQFSRSRGCNGGGLHYAKAAAQERWAKHIGSPRVRFAALWDSLAPAGSKWADNPWVWRIGFALVKP